LATFSFHAFLASPRALLRFPEWKSDAQGFSAPCAAASIISIFGEVMGSGGGGVGGDEGWVGRTGSGIGGVVHGAVSGGLSRQHQCQNL